MKKTALITGGARGIGRVTAMRLLLDGWTVAFTYSRSKAAALEFEKESKGNAAAFEADVRDGEASRRVVEQVVARFGTIDALVNNAGVRRDALLFNMTSEQWDEVLDTNLGGAWSTTKAVLPEMMQQRRGSIVNVASLSGLHGVVGQTNYSAAKGALIAMTRSLSREVARSGIRVNCVAPGAGGDGHDRRARRRGETGDDPPDPDAPRRPRRRSGRRHRLPPLRRRQRNYGTGPGD